MAYRMFRHAILMVIDNLEAALKAGALPILLGYALLYAAVFSATGSLVNDFTVMPEGEVEADAVVQGFGVIGLAALVQYVTLAWAAVNWHRFVLLEEVPRGWMPPLPDTLGSYIIGVILLMLLMGGLVFVSFIPIGIAFAIGGATESGFLIFVAVVIFFVILFGLMVAYFRLGITLPARAKGQPISFRDAWEATADMKWAIFGCMLLFALLQVVLQLILLAASVIGAAEIIGGVALGFVSIMVGASILTTFYGVAIEGRDLR
jgi:hypothetical protein